MQWM